MSTDPTAPHGENRDERNARFARLRSPAGEADRRKLSTTELRAAWSPPCATKRVRVPLYGGAVVTVDARTTEAVQALSDVFARWGYEATPPDTGAYNCRRITGGTGYSLHAYGIAIDVNWLSNPYGPTLVTDMPAGMVLEIESLRTATGAPVWGWGGRYRTNKDAMHYEIVCTPDDLAAGIIDPHKEAPDVTPEQLAAALAPLHTKIEQQAEQIAALVDRFDVFARGGKGYQGHRVPPGGALGALRRIEGEPDE